MTADYHDDRDDTPSVEPDALLPTVEAFAALIRSTALGDYRAATAARKLLRRHGWAVAPCSRGGG
jgi:hypothetical protein